MTELTGFSAVELSAKLALGEFTCVELMKAYLDRIDAVNPGLNAIVAVRPREQLLDEARQADQSPATGWLHGIPIAIKDLAETQDLVTTFGSPLFATNVPSSDCSMVSRLRNAGAIVIGKTNTPEFGLGSHTYNPVYGITRNPYDLKLSAGGSSGGAAAALAARLLPVADGSDMMGSLRNPAAFNNIYGFRPSAGRIPNDKATDSCLFPLATSGPMGRSIIDIAQLLDTLCAHAPNQPWSLPVDTSFAACLQADPTPSLVGKRIGWIGDANGHYPMQDDIQGLCRSALTVFETLECEVHAIELAIDLHELFDAWCTLRSHVVASGLVELFKDPVKRSQLKPEAQWEIERGLAITGPQLHKASTVRSNWFARAAELFDTVDVLCLPSAAVFPFKAEEYWVNTIQGISMTTYHEWMSVVVPASLAGLPSLSIPAGFNANGLPTGLQLMGRYGMDGDMLRFGQAYHLATDWPARRPPDMNL
ncbi:MAG: amidase [Granulosicoccus sp.]